MNELLALKAQGRRIAALDNRPELPATLEWAWEAYAELNAGRRWQYGAPQPITLSELLAYAEVEDLARDEVDDLRYWLRILDNVFLEHMARKAKQQSGRTRSTNRRKGR